MQMFIKTRFSIHSTRYRIRTSSSRHSISVDSFVVSRCLQAVNVALGEGRRQIVDGGGEGKRRRKYCLRKVSEHNSKSKTHFNVKNTFQYQKHISISKTQFNNKKIIAMLKINFNIKNKFQYQKQISISISILPKNTFTPDSLRSRVVTKLVANVAAI